MKIINKETVPIIAAVIVFAIVIIIGFASVSSLGYPAGSGDILGSGIAVIVIASAMAIMSYVLMWGMLKLLRKNNNVA